MDPTDPNLLRRAFGAGDHDAWTELVNLYRPMIRRFALSLGWWPQHLDDLEQEVLIALLEQRGKFQYDPRGRFRNFLYTVVRNVAFALGRKLKRNMQENGYSALVEGLESDEERVRAEWELQWQDHHRRMAYEVVSQRTAPEHWRVFQELTALGLDPKEVAERNGLTVDNVYQIKHRVLLAIQEQVRRQLDEEDRAA